MLKKIVIALIVSLFISTPAWAGRCLADMAAIDAALAKNPSLSAAQMDEVKKERREGEAQHNAGKHAESEATLAKAKKILGIH